MKNFYITISAYIFFIIIILFGIPRSGNDKVSAKAIWPLPPNFYAEIMQNCPYKLGPLQFTKCVTDAMRQYGASSQAIAFTTMLQGQGFLSAFRATGQVDIAQATVIAADHSDEFYLVNGKPTPINIDDPAILEQTTNVMNQNIQYRAIHTQYPQVMLWPGNHTFPTVTKNPSGGQRFIFTYPLKNGCNACATIGYADIGFDFNNGGTFLGPQLISVAPAQPAPAQVPAPATLR